MDATGRLFRHKRVYDAAGTEELFLRAMGENVKRHYALCPEYRAILDAAGFSPAELRSREDLARGVAAALRAVENSKLRQPEIPAEGTDTDPCGSGGISQKEEEK